jgi:hypothetical protein
MPKNQKGGKHKHMKKSGSGRKIDMNFIPVPSDYGDEAVYIGLVTSILGGCRFKIRAMTSDGINSTETIGWIRTGRACRGPRIVVGSVVLYALRDYESRDEENMKADIEYVYVPDEIALLKQLELIPHNYESALDPSGSVGELVDDGFDMVRADTITNEEISKI